MNKTFRSNQKRRPKRYTNPKKTPSKGNPLKIKILTGIVGLLCVFLLAGIGLFLFYIKSSPELTEKTLDTPASSKIFAANLEPLDNLGQRRSKANASEIPQELDDAVVSIEDRRFFNHHGIDLFRIVSSAFHNLLNKNGGLQGGSTLTQQIVKLSVFSTKSSDQTLRRKAQEAWLALNLERKKSKEEILTYYINKVYMANGISGMKTAAETYYNKSLKELSLAQTALLAGMPQAPNAYDPYKYPEAAKKRRDTVLYTMLTNKKITQSQYDKATKEPIDSGLQPLPEENTDRKIVDNYIKEVIDEVKRKTGKDVFTGGLEIYTNIDLDAQKRLYDIVNSDDYVAYPDDKMQVAATLMDVTTGKVVAQIGGRNISKDVYLGNNLAVNTARDFGSNVKPITDYGPAFEYLEKSTGDRIQDAPYNYPGTKIPVKNWDLGYRGNITVRQALYESRNVPAVKLFDEVGKNKVAEFLGKLGIQYKQIQTANAISSNTDTQDGTKYGISTEKMAAAYSALANGGEYYEPSYINKIKYQDGTEQTFESKGTKAMEPYTAYMVTDVLKGVFTQPGGGTNAKIPYLIQAGKTGTSNYTDNELEKITHYGTISPDVMFTGYTTHYALSIWTGYNDHLTPVTSESNLVASSVYRELMAYVSQNVSNEDWTLPSGLLRIGNELYIKGSKSVPYQPASSSYYNNYSSSTVPPASSTTEQSSSSVTTASSSSEQQPEQNGQPPANGNGTPPANNGENGNGQNPQPQR